MLSNSSTSSIPMVLPPTRKWLMNNYPIQGARVQPGGVASNPTWRAQPRVTSRHSEMRCEAASRVSASDAFLSSRINEVIEIYVKGS